MTVNEVREELDLEPVEDDELGETMFYELSGTGTGSNMLPPEMSPDSGSESGQEDAGEEVEQFDPDPLELDESNPYVQTQYERFRERLEADD